MKQISMNDVLELIKTKEFELKSTHNRLCLPIIGRIYKKMVLGIKFSGINVDQNLIIDGHHRYLASKLAGIQLEINPTRRTSATVITNWSSIEIDVEDWDTKAKIKRLNEADAHYNNMSVEEISKQLE